MPTTPATNAWTKDVPTIQGWYWHWNGDQDCAPVPISVLYSGTSGKCFVSYGQLGIERAIDCDLYGGLWLPLHEPVIPVDGLAVPDGLRRACQVSSDLGFIEGVIEGIIGTHHRQFLPNQIDALKDALSRVKRLQPLVVASV